MSFTVFFSSNISVRFGNVAIINKRLHGKIISINDTSNQHLKKSKIIFTTVDNAIDLVQ